MNDTIVKMASSESIFIDERFFREKMDERKNEVNYQMYPVNIVAMRMQWIINHKYGINFMRAILLSSDLNIYKVPYLQIIIEFLYGRIKNIMILTTCTFVIF